MDGAIQKCYKRGKEREEAREKLAKVIGHPNIWPWNDEPDRTFAEVKAAVREAGI